MPKLTVVINAAGDVIGTANFTGDKGAPTAARVLGGPDTKVQEIDVADSDRCLTIFVDAAARILKISCVATRELIS
jgi:hypothetical protein